MKPKKEKTRRNLSFHSKRCKTIFFNKDENQQKGARFTGTGEKIYERKQRITRKGKKKKNGIEFKVLHEEE